MAAAETAQRRWVEPLPAWIMDDPAYASLRAQQRATLRGVAAACQTSDAAGNLLGAFGGQDMIAAAGCSRATFWRHLRRLMDLGYVIQLGTGGCYDNKSYGNQYGIPGRRGALDDRACRRDMRRMVQGADGRYRSTVTPSGAQAPLWPAETHKATDRAADPSLGLRRGAPQNETAPQNEAHPQPLVVGGAARTQPVGATAQNEAPHGNYHGNYSGKDHGASRRRDRGKRLPHFEAAELDDTACLMRLFEVAVERGLVERSQSDRLRFVGAAEHARRVARDPVRLFAHVVNEGRWLFVSCEDESAANERIKRDLYGHRPPDPRGYFES